MAEPIALGAFLQVVFEKTAVLVGGQFKVLWGADVHKEITKLQSIFSTIQAVLEDAEEKQLKNKPIKLWLVKLKDATHDADDILDEFHWEALRQEAEDNIKSKVRHFFSSENPILFRIRMSSKIKEIVERLDGTAEERSKFHLITSSSFKNSNRQYASSRDRTETHSFVIQSEIVGRREDKEKIVEILLSVADRDALSVLPIVGMGGLGKTTLAQMVYNDPRIKEHFQILKWVCVSTEFDVKRLAKEIAGAGEGSSMDSLQQSLREKLSSRRYLLVLDDVWNEHRTKWDDLKVLISHGAKGSAVLVTTRNRGVSSIMGTMDAHSLKVLSEEDCWTLFKQGAFLNGAEEPQNLVKIGKEIVKKFEGLPLAAKTVGGFMSCKTTEEEWLSVLNSEMWDLPAGENDILPALRLSYNQLPSDLKECFSFCAIFPKDYNLEKDVLIGLWMANGLIPSGGAIEEEGHNIFNELVARSFLQNVEEYKEVLSNITKVRCNMHDLIHDLAQAITKNEFCCILKDEEFEKSRNPSPRHVSFRGETTTTIIDKSTSSFCKRMHTLFNLSYVINGRSPTNILLKAKSLRVLAMPRFHMTKFPASVDKLKHLRYLDLSENDFERLPEATSFLFHLQTLKLENCRNLVELPEGMKNLKNLRHLYIYGCNRLSCMPRGMGNLTCLQTLPLYVVGSTASSGSIRELKNLNNIGGRLALCGLNNVKNATDAKEADLVSKNKLQCVHLEWNDELYSENVEAVMECLQPHQNIKQLGISSYPGINFPNWMMRCAAHLPNLVEISLSRCNNCKYLPAFGQLHSLKVLKISRIPGMKKYIGSGAVEIFPSLKEFYLDDMDNLEEWLGMEFPQLISLEIENCPKLTKIPHLPSLQTLKVVACPLLLPEKGFFLEMNSLKELYMKECHKLVPLLNEEEVTGSSPSLGTLEDLSIESCDELISLSDEFMCRLSSLKKLSIGHCKNLVGSPSPSTSTAIGGERGLQLQYLTTLESLKISDCERLVVDPMELLQLHCLKSLQLCRCPNICSLPGELGILTGLKKMKIMGLPRLTSLPQSLGCLTALEMLTISSCGSLTSLPELFGRLTNLTYLCIGSHSLVSLPQSLGCLTALRTLSIADITWQSLPDWLTGLTSLDILILKNCRSLTSLPQGMGSLTQLCDLRIYDCTELTSLPEGMGTLTQLEYLQIYDCTELTSLPEAMGTLTQLKYLTIVNSPKLKSLPESLLQQLPGLEYLDISSCPNLERKCAPGGKYWHLVSRIPRWYIGSSRGGSSNENSRRLLGSTLCNSCHP